MKAARVAMLAVVAITALAHPAYAWHDRVDAARQLKDFPQILQWILDEPERFGHPQLVLAASADSQVGAEIQRAELEGGAVPLLIGGRTFVLRPLMKPHLTFTVGGVQLLFGTLIPVIPVPTMPIVIRIPPARLHLQWTFMPTGPLRPTLLLILRL
ncbi:MAG: hypothetical protein HY660_17380 [Armatimonadetes bacterium]|nr:hypothetical protein [Armatimonadota bacterium]